MVTAASQATPSRLGAVPVRPNSYRRLRHSPRVRTRRSLTREVERGLRWQFEDGWFPIRHSTSIRLACDWRRSGLLEGDAGSAASLNWPCADAEFEARSASLCFAARWGAGWRIPSRTGLGRMAQDGYTTSVRPRSRRLLVGQLGLPQIRFRMVAREVSVKPRSARTPSARTLGLPQVRHVPLSSSFIHPYWATRLTERGPGPLRQRARRGPHSRWGTVGERRSPPRRDLRGSLSTAGASEIRPASCVSSGRGTS